MSVFIYFMVVVVGLFFVYEMVDLLKRREWGENP